MQQQSTMPYTVFHCPWCGAPGQVVNGAAEYTCQCRFTKLLQPSVVERPFTCSVCGQPVGPNHRCVVVGPNTSTSSSSAPEKCCTSNYNGDPCSLPAGHSGTHTL